MQLKHVPTIGYKYWTALVLASIFGANTGDFFSDVMKLGHLSGLPFLTALFGLAVLIERFDKLSHYFYFWFVIIVIRTSATNIGDAFHDFGFEAPWVIAVLSTLLVGTVLVWRNVSAAKRNAHPKEAGSMIVTNLGYWISMLIAGTLGTVIGDYFSFGLELHPLNAAYILGVALIGVFLACRKSLMRDKINIFYYWLTVVMIRSAGTAAGDFLSHKLQLPVSTVVTGLAFVGLLAFWKRSSVPTVNSLSPPEASR